MAAPDATALTAEGGDYAAAYLARLRTGTATPRELAALLQFLDGAMLDGFCSVLHQALARAAQGARP